MKATRRIGLTLPAVLATLVAVLPATPAVAAAKKLVLMSNEVPVAAGSPASVGLLVDKCGIFSNGKVATNSAPKDVLTGTSSSNAECSGGESISGLITESQLSSKGTGKLVGSINLTMPGSCTYTFKSPKVTFPTSGFLFFEGSAKGKLAKAARRRV